MSKHAAKIQLFADTREFFTYLRKKLYHCSRFKRGQLNCYSLDNEKTVYLRHIVPDGTIDAGPEKLCRTELSKRCNESPKIFLLSRPGISSCVFLKSLDRFLLVKLISLSNKSAAVLNPNRSLADLSIGITALCGRHARPTWAVQSRLDIACFPACFPLSYRVTML